MASTREWNAEREYVPEFVPGLHAVRAAFADEIAALGGVVRDAYEDDRRLYLRAVLPATAAIRAGDAVKGGVALRVDGPEVNVHPYTFRLVCSNGAIAAQALATRRLDRIECHDGGVCSAYDVALTLAAIRDAVRACADPAVFDELAHELRTAAEAEADVFLHLLPALVQMPRLIVGRLMAQMMDAFRQGGDSTRFGLLNAITALARDERDPALRWDLEALGGSLPARLSRPRVVVPAAQSTAAAPD